MKRSFPKLKSLKWIKKQTETHTPTSKTPPQIITVTLFSYIVPVHFSMELKITRFLIKMDKNEGVKTQSFVESNFSKYSPLEDNFKASKEHYEYND